MSTMGWVALSAPALPLLSFVIMGLPMLFGQPLPEIMHRRLATLSFAGSVLATLVVAAYFVTHGDAPLVLPLGMWFVADGEGFHVSLLVDRLSAPMMVLTATLCGLIGHFSSTYLEGEPGQRRFFLLLCLFASGMFLLVMAGSLDLLVAGWEMVGLSSMLLIAFFHERPFPVRNALRAFVTYRVCDIGLLLGVVLMHHYAGSGDFVTAFGGAHFPAGKLGVDAPWASWVALPLFLAACGKSALFPVGGWLPRAMEGPTPSSAIFYGALSVHAGAYLMLRLSPVLEQAPLARAVIVGIGLSTALVGSLVSRVQTDVKSQLAYATSTQVGIIFVEIGLGFPRLALLHLAGHACLRTLQLLRAPNAIADVQVMRALHQQEMPQDVGAESEPRWAVWLYHLSLERFHLEAFWERVLVGPVLAVARGIERFEQHLVARMAGASPTSGPLQRTPATPPREREAS